MKSAETIVGETLELATHVSSNLSDGFEIDHDQFRVGFGAPERKLKAVRLIGRALKATLGAFLHYYNASANPIGKLDAWFEQGACPQ